MICCPVSRLPLLSWPAGRALQRTSEILVGLFCGDLVGDVFDPADPFRFEDDPDRHAESLLFDIILEVEADHFADLDAIHFHRAPTLRPRTDWSK